MCKVFTLELRTQHDLALKKVCQLFVGRLRTVLIEVSERTKRIGAQTGRIHIVSIRRLKYLQITNLFEDCQLGIVKHNST